jgi:hypothetical protein
MKVETILRTGVKPGMSDFFSVRQVEEMAKSRRASRSVERKSRKAERKSRRAERKTRKQAGGKRAPSEWNKAVKRVYGEMKRKDRNASFGDALKEASKRKKAGNL